MTTTGVATSPTTTVRPFLKLIRERVAEGELRADPAQERVAKRLGRLQKALVGYDNEVLFAPPDERITKSVSSSDDSIAANEATAPNPEEESPPPPPTLRIPRGLYIHGSVGSGKSMLMDAFYEQAPVEKKARFHFHSFLAQVHEKIHHLKQQDLQEKGRSYSIDTSVENNPIYRVGLELSESLSLLCLDEFQVTDIADAVILSQLFSVLFRKGTVVVATSNRPPQDLYEGGLNRSYFLPFLDLLEKHCVVHAIQSDVDYRRVLASCSSFYGTTEEIRPILGEVLETIVEDDVETPTAVDLQVGFKRTLAIDRAYGTDSPVGSPSLCRLDFFRMCDSELGALDYRAVARRFDIVSLENVVPMDLEGHNRARRFITLIDELYEAKCCLLLSTSTSTTATAADLFCTGNGSAAGSVTPGSYSDDHGETEEVVLGVDVATEGGLAVGALASVRELAFAFERASSRIVEMSSRSWWNRRLSERTTTS